MSILRLACIKVRERNREKVREREKERDYETFRSMAA